MSKLDVNYSPELDILSIDDTESEYGRSIRSGDFTVDLDPNGELRGVEIQNISRMLGVDREQLQNITEAELQLVSSGENAQITVRLKVEEERTTLAAQIQDTSAPSTA
ncbi:MAG: DUF2283 domain-containing protein [Candidatus Nanohalobium sp.]